MLDKIEVKLDDVKQIYKKHSFDMDHFWIEINKRFNLSKSKNAGERSKRCGVPILVLFQVALCFPFLPLHQNLWVVFWVFSLIIFLYPNNNELFYYYESPKNMFKTWFRKIS